MTKDFLTVTDHNRDVSGLKYIYPVISRRAGGVSIGINLNVNNACNWRCIYCQVPELTRGTPPPIDMALLESELRSFLSEIIYGKFMESFVSETDRHLKDIAFSGNGEPTSAKEFPEVILLVERVLRDFNLLGGIKIRLITNGSLIDKPEILTSLNHLSSLNGEVWFKVDSGTKEGISRINDVILNPQSHIKRLIKCADACPTFIQTCMVELDGKPPSTEEISAYLALISEVKHKVLGVHLYGLARPSLQKEAPRLRRLPQEWLENMAKKIRAIGLETYVNP